MKKFHFSPLVFAALLLTLALILSTVYWQRDQEQRANRAQPGFAQGNGRLEARQIDIASKLAGRIQRINVREGDPVRAGQVLAEMEVTTLEAALREAQAQMRRAENARATAEAIVAQRRQAEQTAQAIVAQREGEVGFAEKQLQRSRQLVAQGFNAPQKLDLDQTQRQSAAALLSAARSQAIEAQTGILAAQSQVIEAQSGIEAARATVERLRTELAEASLKAPRSGRVQYRLVEPGEIIGSGGKILTLVDLSDVSMTVYLPSAEAGRIAIGAEARLVLDAAPQYVIPASVSYVAAQAQFTPKSVETTSERQKLVFQVKLQLDPEQLKHYEARVKSGLPGMATIRIDPSQPWPARLAIKLPPPSPMTATPALPPAR